MRITTFHQSRPPLAARVINRMGKILLERGHTVVDLDENALLDAACRRAGLSDWGDESFREPMRVYLRSCQEDGRLTILGRLWAREFCISLLTNRLKIQDTLKQYPEIRQVPIERPLFILGLPRTGSTLLHNLLALDPDARAPLIWELDSPCPPPTPETTAADARARQARYRLWFFNHMSPGFHVGHLMHSQRPDECGHIFMKTFLDIHCFLAFGAWGYFHWLMKQDLRPAYEYYRTVLQILMWKFPGRRLVVKYPYHLRSLDIVLELFPDAHIVQTHRDPRKVLPSIATLGALSMSTVTDHVDLPRFGRNLYDYYVEFVAKGMQFRRDLAAGQCIDIQYRDLLRDPIAEVQRIQHFFGYDFSEPARERMSEYLRDNPQHKFGVFQYDLESFGFDEESIRHDFQAYCETYGVPAED
jgi:hypothetical protein